MADPLRRGARGARDRPLRWTPRRALAGPPCAPPQEAAVTWPAVTGDEWWRPLPRGFSVDGRRVLAGKSVRAFADGFVSLLLPIYLLRRGFSALAIGAIITSPLRRPALLPSGVGLVA